MFATNLSRRVVFTNRALARRKGCTGIRWSHGLASVPGLTPVEKIVLDSVKATGPISFAKYMQLCLSHPTHGYYMNPNNAVFGTSGDFITSPEISQVFGELVGVWLVSQWADAGTPPAIRLVELGPGRGTLMDDILRIVKKFLPEKALTGVHLVETSEALRSVQKAKLGEKCDLHFHNGIHEIPRNPSVYTMLVAHEFFDALPVHVVQKTEAGWNEVMIASNDSLSSSESSPSQPQTQKQGVLRRVLNPLPSPASTLLGNSSLRFRNLPIGSTIEVSPTSFRIAHQIGRLLSARGLEEKPLDLVEASQQETGVGGCGLVIDYGADHAFGDSFRAFKEHKIVDVFHRPGECDITANVDFAYLKEAMTGLIEPHGPITQADFLERMALQTRVEALVRNASSEERKKVILDAANRLVDRSGMGTQYKVLGITSSPKSSSTGVWPFDVQNQALES
ncbi:hypothetical protein CC2G_007209 [Coprinopsis cinerea AmutBmut pab1-1]|nr:hypothetical protein CC2G_007209 [Coprinopsis cinerea AmutBmut pab1-1]